HQEMAQNPLSQKQPSLPCPPHLHLLQINQQQENLNQSSSRSWRKRKKKRAEQQKLEQGKWKADQDARRKAAYEKRKKEEEDAQKKKASLMDKFGGKATSVGPIGPKKTVAGGSTRMMVQNPATIKAKLLEWSQRCARGYPNVTIQNFSSSWCDGMAFCAVVHSYYPDAFDFNSLDPQNRRFNFDLAFDTAEKLADIYPLLETDDMIMMKNKPDWKVSLPTSKLSTEDYTKPQVKSRHEQCASSNLEIPVLHVTSNFGMRCTLHVSFFLFSILKSF
ncbi:putative smoothelin isoform X5, partial [Apostichopus japonicus]